MNDLGKTCVIWDHVDAQTAGQRIDNFLFKELKGVPKSHVYQILRSGQVRVNSKRIEATYRLQAGDRVRIPPVRASLPPKAMPRRGPLGARLTKAIVYEDDYLLALNKPAGVAVHGGSGVSLGAIEQLRLEHPQFKFLELVHRLDRETSGILLVAKQRAALLALHELLRAGAVDKRYLALVSGKWGNENRNVTFPVHKYITASGERRVAVREDGQHAHTVFRLLKSWREWSLLEAELKTGRTHQIRVHLAHLNFPIAGDDKYGDFALNRKLGDAGLKRMFLHAARLTFAHPVTRVQLNLEAPLPTELTDFLAQIDRAGA